MEKRKYVMSVAGFDPSGGAGLAADIKTFEAHGVNGLSVLTGNTVQTESIFYSVQWENLETILKTIDVLIEEYPVSFVKTGIVPSFGFLNEIILHLKKNIPNVKIIVDPVIKSGTGFNFQTDESPDKLEEILNNIFLITPNCDEAMLLTGKNDVTDAAKLLAKNCNVLLKGGHNIINPGFDYLYSEGNCIEIYPGIESVFPKHGSGCVLSAAISANLTLGETLTKACVQAKKYTEKFLASSPTLSGHHYAE